MTTPISMTPHEATHTHRYERQPNSQTCFVCGVANPFGLKLRFYTITDTEVETRIYLEDNYQGYPGIAHGGIIATILDETMGRAMLGTDPERLMVTGKMEIRYRQSIPLETEIVVRGRILKDRIRIAQAEAQAILPDGTVAVEALGTLVMVPPDKLAEMNTPEVGWRLYEDHEFE
jgi:acyl-coenzyme A thioesterase PaaI-like protein